MTKTLSIPTVFIDSYVDDDSIYTIHSDDFRGAYLATKQLCQLGHKAIAFASGKEVYHLEAFNKMVSSINGFWVIKKPFKNGSLNHTCLVRKFVLMAATLLEKSLLSIIPIRLRLFFQQPMK
ncbi:hypothetical protein STRIC_0803 [Streptococcus ictaluri 707-05]|uniref:Periplasmic binding protein and sugar binding domain of the LacI family protein n=1 Tax=Streptococcus ictaluri 707-05 TaxID=764299 RepID=G5JZT9_9STRE|nr:hypothetical protein STRIC_0803 [Streptococcus ictaluri 707-05]